MSEQAFHFHTCAVCTRRITADKLMCWPHWKLVPPDLATAVYRDWHALQRAYTVEQIARVRATTRRRARPRSTP